MCGIAALFAYHNSAPPIERDELLAIRDQMTSRGPDGEGEWISPDRRVGLGHRRLSIIDLSPTGAQPMWNGDHSLGIVFNGEIYNYRELRARLENDGCHFQSQSDTEVLLHLYARHGETMFDDVRGMYAFAIWDKRRDGLFLARDPFGIKPLYVADDGKTVRVASQLKALRAGGKISLTPEPAGHVGYFLWGHVPEPYTMYRGVRSLPAGSSLWIGRDGTRRQRTFCDIARVLAEGENAAADGAAHVALRDALFSTVRYHLVADVPVGVFLSSGLDSTTIAALASEQGGELRTVTLGFDEYRGKPDDETVLAEKFARAFGTRHETVWVSRADFETEREHLFAAMDRPTTDGVNTFFVSLAARRAGLKVALSGVGGDETFGGYPSFDEIPRLVRLARLARKLPFSGRALRLISAPILKLFTSPKYASILEYGDNYAGAYLLRRGMFMPWELPDLLDPELVREGWQELQPLLRLSETVDGLRNPRVRISSLEMCWYMRNQLLRDSDWAGMAHSLEIRTPLVDVRFLHDIAPLLAAKHPPTKQDAARTPCQPFPDEILHRKKTGFTIPVREWLMEQNPTLRERGLRGWAKYVYRGFPGEALVRPGNLRGRRFARHTSADFSASASQRFSVSSRRILIFRIGQLGDTIVSLPAMHAVKENFPDAHIALLCDRHPGRRYVLASDLLRGAGIFDEFLSYPVSESTDLLRPGRMASLLATIRRKGFDTLVYLAPTSRKREQIRRDYRFFSLAGIKTFIGMEGFHPLPAKRPGIPLEAVAPESELLLSRLATSGLRVDANSATNMDLGLGKAEETRVTEWQRHLPSDGGRPWIAVAPGSKMPAKRWPIDRFQTVLQQLIEEFDIWPVVFGGAEDREIGDDLLGTWKRGYNAAGALSLRPAIAAIRHCQLFIGNDTGTMHMAAAVGVPCVVTFSSRDRPGLWYPHGNGHRVFRSAIECEGCGLVECLERQNECLKRIATDEVLEACRGMLSMRLEARGLVATT